MSLIRHDLYGLVLSGGKSTRMGIDKGTIQYHNTSQREYLFTLLSAVCEKVYTSCNKNQSLDSHLNPLMDEFDVYGPMNGILSAFKKHADKAWLIIAIDLPNVDLKTVNELIRHRNTSRLATCFYNKAAEAPEPLLTIWEPAAASLLMENVAVGQISPRYFLRTNNVEIVHPYDEAIFVNINNTDERDRWIKRD